ncbi:MAG: DNA primase, partial [Phototrophicales bacterium]
MSFMSVTDDIKSRIDIASYIQRYVPSLKKAGRNYKACCPFHNEKTPSFVVNPETQTWRCFGACAEGGDLFTFAQKMHGWDFKEALRELGEQAGVQIREQTPEQKSREEHLDRLRGILTTA